MARFNLKAAQNAALMALGEHGESVIANLDAVGLVIVRKADLPREAKVGRELHDVRLHLPDGWTDPYHVTVTGGGLEEPVTWGVEFAAISTVREAAGCSGESATREMAVTSNNTAAALAPVRGARDGEGAKADSSAQALLERAEDEILTF